MKNKNIKLFEWKRLFIIIAAMFIGAFWRSAREYFNTGTIKTLNISIALITFFIGLIILAVFIWWANKPEKP
jgi:hypothetical protein